MLNVREGLGQESMYIGEIFTVINQFFFLTFYFYIFFIIFYNFFS